MFSFLRKKQSYKMKAVVSGTSINMEDVNDVTFSQKLMGEGIAIIPNSDTVISPCDGKINALPESKHAFGIVSDDGVEILVHIGIDTVNLNGNGFKSEVSVGSVVKEGDKVISFEREKIAAQGVDCTTMMIVLNHSEFTGIDCVTGESVVAGQSTVIEVAK